MRVVLDVQAGLTQRAGVGRYTKSLAEALLALESDANIIPFHFDVRPVPGAWRPPSRATRTCSWFPRRLAQAGWTRLRFPPFDWFAGAADVFHFPNFVRPPVRRGATVVTVHDLSFLRFPDAAERRNLRYLSRMIAPSVARADQVIADSQFVAAEIAERFGAPPSKVTAVPLGVEAAFSKWAGVDTESRRARLRERLGLEAPFLLHVGTLEPRKNIAFLVDVFERLENYDGELILAGRVGWNAREALARIDGSPCRARIRRLEAVDDADLPLLYAGADIFVFPSLEEGFGLPPLEAMAAGTPVLAAATGSLPEVLGDAAESVTGFRAEEWAHRLAQLLEDSALRAERRVQGIARAAGFRWEDTAKRTLDVYRRAAASK